MRHEDGCGWVRINCLCGTAIPACDGGWALEGLGQGSVARQKSQPKCEQGCAGMLPQCCNTRSSSGSLGRSGLDPVQSNTKELRGREVTWTSAYHAAVNARQRQCLRLSRITAYCYHYFCYCYCLFPAGLNFPGVKAEPYPAGGPAGLIPRLVGLLLLPGVA